jgi:trehalose-phosphatase
VHVAIVSGRSLGDLSRFDFPPAADLIGSHGMETSSSALRPLDDVERQRLDTLRQLAADAASAAGEGAWVESKPASVVLHVREASPELASSAMDTLRWKATAVEGTSAKNGSAVLELFTRSASKGDALTRLGRDIGVASSVFVGDDVTDEEAFAVLGTGDVTVKVGGADTIAAYRLRDPDAVAEWLADLANVLTDS